MILSDVSQRRLLVTSTEMLNHIERTTETSKQVFSYYKVQENLYLAILTDTVVGDYHRGLKRTGYLKGIARLDLFEIQEWLKNKEWRKEIMTDEHREAAELIQKYSEENGLSYVEGLLKVKKMLSERAATQNTDNNLTKKPL